VEGQLVVLGRISQSLSRPVLSYYFEQARPLSEGIRLSRHIMNAKEGKRVKKHVKITLAIRPFDIYIYIISTNADLLIQF
jgi:hypothetical protein